jgi:hypothetical protein
MAYRMGRYAFAVTCVLALTLNWFSPLEAQTSAPRVVHVIVALADNTYQGIVPVPRAIGNGDDYERNLYWGAGYGVRTFLKRSTEWKLIGCSRGEMPVLERCLFRHKSQNVTLVADAYRGREIKRAVADLLAFSAGRKIQTVALPDSDRVSAGGGADLVIYVGHDGLMDFRVDGYETPADHRKRETIILACASKIYFNDPLRYTSAQPLLWTTNLMAPEGYIVEAALSGWVRNESGEQIRERAAQAYDKYQHCGIKGARRLFATGW